MKDNIIVGKITSPHGILGEMKVYPLTDDPQRFSLLKTIIIDNNVYPVERVRYHKNMVILKIKGIDDRNQADSFNNSYVEIQRSEAVKLQEGQYFIVDLIGLNVYEKKESVGELIDVIQSGSTDIYVVSDNYGKEIMIPAIKDYILNIDINKGTMDVNIPEGLKKL